MTTTIDAIKAGARTPGESAARPSQSDRALLRRRQVEQLVGLSRSSIYAAVRSLTFPAPYRIGARAVAWKLSELETWLADRPVAGRQAREGERS